MKGLFEVHFIQWWLWNFHGVQALRLKLMELIHSRLVLVIWDISYLREGMDINKLLFGLWKLKERMHKKMPSFMWLSKKTFDQSISPSRLWMECLCGPLDGNNSIIQQLHKSSCQKCAKHNRLATLHLDYVNYPIFLTWVIPVMSVRMGGGN